MTSEMTVNLIGVITLLGLAIFWAGYVSVYPNWIIRCVIFSLGLASTGGVVALFLNWIVEHGNQSSEGSP